MNSPVSLSRPMRTQASGPSNGTPPMVMAREAPMTQITSTGFFDRPRGEVATTWTLLRKPSGKDGRNIRTVDHER